MPEGLPAVGAQGERGLFLLSAGGLHDRNELARDEREGDKDRRQHDPRHREDDFEVVRSQPFAKKALQAEQHDEHQPGDDRRHRERQINQGDQHGFAAEPEFGDGPRGGQPEKGIERDANTRHQERQANGRPGVRVGERIPVERPPFRQRLDENVHQRQEQEYQAKCQCDRDERPLDKRRFLGAAL